MKKTSPRYFIIVFLFSLFLPYACQHRPSDSIDLTREVPMSVFDLYSRVETIQLETPPDALIGSIRKIEYYDGFYYIIDVVTQQIFCFDKDGSFIFKIDDQGKGPGEYNYISDFAIDRHNNRMIVLEPPLGRVLIFDLKGNHISTRRIDTGKVMGFNKVFPINDSILLITSITYEQLVFYCLEEDKVIHTDFEIPVPGSLNPVGPQYYVYQFNGGTYALKALSREVYDISEVEPVPYFTWCFGENNNSDGQIDRLIDEKTQKAREGGFTWRGELVGRGKILTKYIWKLFENSRFRFALLEYDNDFRHVVIDKESDETYVFSNFTEGISLAYNNSIQSDRVIAYETGTPERLQSNRGEEFAHRRLDHFTMDILPEEDRKIVENHDEMHENPFLVVYFFKE